MELQKTNDSRARVGDRFKPFVSQHSIWQNPLLKACERNELTLADYGYVISQHFYYSRGFTRLIAALMVNCDDDKFRAELSHNLWEEAGEEDSEERHSNLLRKMLNNVFGISNPDETQFKDHTVNYFNECLQFLKHSNSITCAAFLGWGTEGVVADIYNYLFSGLTRLGVAEEELLYLSLHMECDDEHAEVIEDIALSQCGQNLDGHSQEIKAAIDMALTLRDKYFTALYQDLTSAKLNGLIGNITNKKTYRDADDIQSYASELKADDGAKLYSNVDAETGINFNVSRFNIGCEVMDPRLLEIPQGCRNERHKHAHESMFYILSGTGRVYQGEQSITVKAGDLVYVPRWIEHYSENTGEETLSVLAITDFGLTKNFPQNTDYSYRSKVTSIA
ncbi:iron-containing redox enzyme family protein [Thalassomonas viridans]|uniref:Iron-containing redox enzyme family protein n=1 Tax=Thalassomonas viridans TaxID=137584 RepID=A0AAE9Z3K3_9GAMM|nr:iron-containing redox enzyme family protein [Thalassomonas viridans]WDE05394.1 iron-containing redox enzyme family protein [Thalassomonas viridans]